MHIFACCRKFTRRATTTTPDSRGGNITLIMAISASAGVVHHSICEHPMNTRIFLEFMENLLRVLEEPKVVVLDNVSFHSNGRAQDLIESYGHSLLLLPPYSPFLNPIEEIFHLVKVPVLSKSAKHFSHKWDFSIKIDYPRAHPNSYVLFSYF